MVHFIGADLGGTWIKAVIMGKDGVVHSKRQMETRASEGRDAVVARIVGLIDTMRREHGHPISAVGIAVPGVLNMDDGVIALMPNFPDSWEGFSFPALLQEETRLPVFAVNDARAATYGEKIFGAARQLNHFASIIIGTGVGGGIVSNGQLLFGSKGAAGEIGHQVVEPYGLHCGCGNRGCLETVASGPAIVSSAIRVINQGLPTLLSTLTRGDLNAVTVKMIDEAARAGDEISIRILRETAKHLGMAIQNLKALLNPEAILFGGGVARSDLLLRYMEQELDGRNVLFPDSIGSIRIVRAHFGELSGAVGAASWAMGQGG